MHDKKFELLEKARKAKTRLSAEEETEFTRDLDFLTITYGIEFVKGKWEELEKKILSCDKTWKDPYNGNITKYISEYSTEILRKRWTESEEFFLKLNLSQHHVNYAKKLKFGRWKELEEKIIKKISKCEHSSDRVTKTYTDEEDAYIVGIQYAAGVIKDRWPELEKKLIKQTTSHYYDIQYARIFKKRWPELENKIIKSSNPSFALSYIRICKERIKELEALFEGDGRYGSSHNYKNHVKKIIEKLLKNKDHDEILKYCDYENYASIIKVLSKKYHIPDVLKNSILAQSLVGDKESLKALSEDKVFKNKIKEYIKELIENNTISEDSSAREILRIIG